MLRYRINYPTNKWEDTQNVFNDKFSTLASEDFTSKNFTCEQSFIINAFVLQLKEDESILNDETNVSDVTDCGLSAPRRGSYIDKKYELAKKIALTMYPPEEDTKEKRLWSYIRYSQLISKLKKKFIAQLELKVNYEQVERNNKMSLLRRNFSTLKNRPSTNAVINPTPMPVEVAQLDELADFFSHLKSNIQIVDEEYVQFTRGACYRDGRMDLCKQVVGSTWIEPLMNSLINNDKIKHFLLGNNIIDTKGAQAIANFIATEHKPKIETWYIAGNCIDSEGIELIAKSLRTDTDTKALWLKRNPLNANGAKALGEMLKYNASIECIDLHNTNIGDEGMQYLCEGLLENITLKRLYLDANNITIEGMRHLHNYFITMAAKGKIGLQSLWIGMNRYEDEGVLLLADAFSQYKHMERLSVNSSRITANGAKALCDSMISHEKLVLFDLGMYKSTGDMGELPNNLMDEGAEHISEFIRNNKHVKVLDISQNGITEEGMNKIINAMQENTTLCYIYYDQYGSYLSPSVKKNIKACMEKNIQIQYGITYAEFHTSKLRFLKHTEDILKIDSIYRNKM